MSKNAYLMVPDLHLWDRNKENRVDYTEECINVVRTVSAVVDKYNSTGHDVILCFLGDVFDRGYRSVSLSCQHISLLTSLVNKCKIAYSLVGNHELSFAKNNPFWSLVSSIDDERLTNNERVTRPLGFTSVLNVTDVVKDGDVHFHFNHYPCEDSIPNRQEASVHVAMFHREMYNSTLKAEILRMGVEAHHLKLAVGNLEPALKYDYCFLGHMHCIVQSWCVEQTELHYLGNLGRPNVAEVRDDLADRNIPAVLVYDGKLERVEANRFKLPKRADVVLESVVEDNHDKYLLAKKSKQFKEYIHSNDDPVKNLTERTLGTFEGQILEIVLADNSNLNFGKYHSDLVNMAKESGTDHLLTIEQRSI